MNQLKPTPTPTTNVQLNDSATDMPTSTQQKSDCQCLYEILDLEKFNSSNKKRQTQLARQKISRIDAVVMPFMDNITHVETRMAIHLARTAQTYLFNKHMEIKYREVGLKALSPSDKHDCKDTPKAIELLDQAINKYSSPLMWIGREVPLQALIMNGDDLDELMEMNRKRLKTLHSQSKGSKSINNSTKATTITSQHNQPAHLNNTDHDKSKTPTMDQIFGELFGDPIKTSSKSDSTTDRIKALLDTNSISNPQANQSNNSTGKRKSSADPAPNFTVTQPTTAKQPQTKNCPTQAKATTISGLKSPQDKSTSLSTPIPLIDTHTEIEQLAPDLDGYQTNFNLLLDDYSTAVAHNETLRDNTDNPLSSQRLNQNQINPTPTRPEQNENQPNDNTSHKTMTTEQLFNWSTTIIPPQTNLDNNSNVKEKLTTTKAINPKKLKKQEKKKKSKQPLQKAIREILNATKVTEPEITNNINDLNSEDRSKIAKYLLDIASEICPNTTILTTNNSTKRDQKIQSNNKTEQQADNTDAPHPTSNTASNLSSMLPTQIVSHQTRRGKLMLKFENKVHGSSLTIYKIKELATALEEDKDIVIDYLKEIQKRKSNSYNSICLNNSEILKNYL